jgi:triphosphoribosyl-dephospho-CoA synthase
LLFDLALPTLSRSLAQGHVEAALVQTLFAVMAELDDTNLLHRGGPEGLAFVRAQARAFLDTGGAVANGWRERAFALHRACIARRLSPGGAADMLAAAAFVHDLRAGAVAS